MKRCKGWRMSLILQCIHRFTYVSAHYPTLPPLHLRHSSFSDPSAASPTSQLILQPYRSFTYVTAHSPTLPPLHLRHSSFYNPSLASPTSHALHVRHLESRPCQQTIVMRLLPTIQPPIQKWHRQTMQQPILTASELLQLSKHIGGGGCIFNTREDQGIVQQLW